MTGRFGSLTRAWRRFLRLARRAQRVWQKYYPEIIFLLVSVVCLYGQAAWRGKNSAGVFPVAALGAENDAAIIAEEIAFLHPDIWTKNDEPFVALLNDKFFAGDPVTVVFLPPHENGVSKIADTTFTADLYNLEDTRLARGQFFAWECDAEGRVINAAFFTVPSSQKTGSAKLLVQGNSGFKIEMELFIEERDYESEQIVLNKKLTQIRTTSDPERTRQAQKLWAILAHTGETIYTQDVFVTPIKRDTRRTSFFGDKRVYKYANGTTDSTTHAGIDYGVPTGTEVAACANGLVVLAQERIVTGNSVIIEHLPGVYSIYYHLDTILASEGDFAEAGQIIGLSGATGLATGPHLHWEIRAAAENTDPDFVSDLPLLDAEALYKKFYALDETGEQDKSDKSDKIEKSDKSGESDKNDKPDKSDSFVNRWLDNDKTFFAMLHENPRPGDPVTLVFYPQTKNGQSEIPDQTFKAACYAKGGRKISGGQFFDWPCDKENHIIKAAVFAIPSTVDPQSATIRIEGDKGFRAEFSIAIEERVFELDLVALNKTLTDMRTAYDPEKTAQAQQLYAILGTTGRDIWTTETFTAPLPRGTRRTSPFGDKRVYKYADGRTDTAIHAGIDYGVPTGTEITACAAGRVVLAMERIVTGNSVIIEHYPGVYSIYYHLDSIKARKGDMLSSGDIIGLSGASGLATGPHLHWEIRISGENTNPDTLCDLPLLNSERLNQAIEAAESVRDGALH